MQHAALTFLAVAAALGCTSSTPAPSAPVSCQSTVISLCNAACTCGDTTVSKPCAIGNYVDGAGGGGVTWSSASACERYFSFACAEAAAPAGFDFMACSNALPMTGCVSTVNGPALLFPAACGFGVPDAGSDSAK